MMIGVSGRLVGDMVMGTQTNGSLGGKAKGARSDDAAIDNEVLR